MTNKYSVSLIFIHQTITASPMGWSLVRSHAVSSLRTGSRITHEPEGRGERGYPPLELQPAGESPPWQEEPSDRSEDASALANRRSFAHDARARRRRPARARKGDSLTVEDDDHYGTPRVSHYSARGVLLGTECGHVLLLIATAGVSIVTGAGLWLLSGECATPCANTFSQALWQSYTLFIDPGTQVPRLGELSAPSDLLSIRSRLPFCSLCFSHSSLSILSHHPLPPSSPCTPSNLSLNSLHPSLHCLPSCSQSFIPSSTPPPPIPSPLPPPITTFTPSLLREGRRL